MLDGVGVVPIFPLPNVVVFPRSSVPLHIFEPRYRIMVEDMLENKRPALAMVQLQERERNPGDNPPIHAVGCAGRVENLVRNRDGTFDFVFSALLRVRLREVPSQTPYRLAELHPCEELHETAVDPKSLRALADCVLATVTRENTNADRFDLSERAGALTDTITDRFIRHPGVRQDLLETFDVKLRVEKLLSLFVQHMAADQRPDRAKKLN